MSNLICTIVRTWDDVQYKIFRAAHYNKRNLIAYLKAHFVAKRCNEILELK
jgi:hypothetical protein